MNNKTIHDWQKTLREAREDRFENSKTWTNEEDLLSILRQLADTSGAIQYEHGTYKKDCGDPNHRLASLIADAFILADKRNFDLENELGKVLEFFKDKTKPLSK